MRVTSLAQGGPQITLLGRLILVCDLPGRSFPIPRLAVDLAMIFLILHFMRVFKVIHSLFGLASGIVRIIAVIPHLLIKMLRGKGALQLLLASVVPAASTAVIVVVVPALAAAPAVLDASLNRPVGCGVEQVFVVVLKRVFVGRALGAVRLDARVDRDVMLPREIVGGLVL